MTDEVTALRLSIARRAVEQAIDDLVFARQALRSLRDAEPPETPRKADYRTAAADMDDVVGLLHRIGSAIM